MGTTVVRAEGLGKRYGPVRALDGFDLEIAAGEIVGLAGPNGAGKSTFVAILTALARPDSGEIRINGRTPRAARGDVGVAPQRIALYPSATVAEHLRLFGGLAGLKGTELRTQVAEVVAAVRLGECLGRRTGVLSGGQQRRTQAAIALLHRPGVLVLDEPTAGADPETRQALLDVVRRRADEGAAVLYITHYRPELDTLRARTVHIARGRVTPEEAAS